MTYKKALVRSAIVSIAVFASCNPPDPPVSKQEAVDFAKRIERSVTQQNEKFLDNIFDEKRFTQRVLSEAHQRFNLSLATEAKTAITETHWGHQVVAATTGAGTYSLVHQYEKDGHQHLLFRLFQASGAINYHDFELVKTDQGVKAVDVYVYLSGEELSKILAESLVLVSDKLSDMTPDEQSKLLHIKKINELVENGKADEAGQYFDQIPADLKKQRIFQQIHLRIASKLGDSIYLEALNEYKSSFPQDPNLYLLMLDAYVMEKDYPKALSAVNHLDSALHTDPFLDFYRALVYKLETDPARSRMALEHLHRNMPTFAKGTAELMDNYINAGFTDSAAILLKQAVADSSINPTQVEAIEQVYPNLKTYMK